MATREFEAEGFTRNQELHRMNMSRPPDARPDQVKALGRADRFAREFTTRPGIMDTVRQARPTVSPGLFGGTSTTPPEPDYSDLGPDDALAIYKQVANNEWLSAVEPARAARIQQLLQDIGGLD